MKLKLFFPLSNGNRISQRFGENKIPLYRQLNMAGHNGLDIVTYHGEPVYAAHDGVVLRTERDSFGGLGLDLVTEEMFEDANGKPYYWKTRYWHLKSFVKTVGDAVKTGDLICYADNTGFSTGSHLHFGLKRLVKNNNGEFDNVDEDNGYHGATNPEPYLNLEPSQKIDILKKLIYLYQKLIAALAGNR